jgi:hypothetical protein
MKRRFPREGVRAPAFWLMDCSLRNLLGMFSEDQTASISTDGPKLSIKSGFDGLRAAAHGFSHGFQDTVEALDLAAHRSHTGDGGQGDEAENEAVLDESLALFVIRE